MITLPSHLGETLRPPMTRRLTILIVGVVLATLLLVGGGTLVLANVRARHTTERELRAEAEKRGGEHRRARST